MRHLASSETRRNIFCLNVFSSDLRCLSHPCGSPSFKAFSPSPPRQNHRSRLPSPPAEVFWKLRMEKFKFSLSGKLFSSIFFFFSIFFFLGRRARRTNLDRRGFLVRKRRTRGIEQEEPENKIKEGFNLFNVKGKKRIQYWQIWIVKSSSVTFSHPTHGLHPFLPFSDHFNLSPDFDNFFTQRRERNLFCPISFQLNGKND